MCDTRAFNAPPAGGELSLDAEFGASRRAYINIVPAGRWVLLIGIVMWLTAISSEASISIDASVSRNGASASSSVSTTAFSTNSGNELLLAFVATDYLSGSNTTVTSMSGAGLTWTLVRRTNVQSGSSEIWRAFATAPLSSVVVTASLSQSVLSSITVLSYIGIDTSGTNGSGAVGATGSANTGRGAPSASLVTTRNGSWVFAVGNDYDNAIPRTVPSGQALVNQDLTNTGDTYWVQMQSAPTPLSGTTVRINDTAPTGDRFNLSIVEVLPALSGSGYTISGSITPSTLAAGTAVALSLNGTTVGTTAADGSGNFSFANLQNGAYVVTPSKAGVIFSPTSQSVTVNGTSISGVNFTASPQTWSLSGAVTPALQGVTVTLGGAAQGSTTTDDKGSYSFTGLSNGSYSVTPTLNGYIFNPASKQVTINNGNLTNINFVVTSAQTWSISGTITPATSGITVNLSGASTASTTTDGSGNYAFAGLSNGTYNITPSQLGYNFTPSSVTVTISGANVTGQNFTRHQATHGTLTIDANVSADSTGAYNTIGTSSFSTQSNNELLLAFVEADYLSGPNTRVNNIAGGGLTWTLVERANVQSGTAEIWRAFATTPLTNVTVSATLSQSVYASITVLSFTGVDTSGTHGSGATGAIASGNAATGAPATSLVTTRNGSWTFGVGVDYDNAIARSPALGQTIVHQDLSPSGDTYWVQIQMAPTPLLNTPIFINDTAPTTDRYNLAVVEVLPAPGNSQAPPAVSITSPAPNSSIASLTTVTASVSDTNYSIEKVQFVLDGSNLGSEITSYPYAMTWDTTTVASGPHTLTAVVYNSAQLSASSAPVTVVVDNSGNPAVVGSWSSVASLPTVAVNLILLYTNKVLFYEDGNTPNVWDYVNGGFAEITTSIDLFCSGQATLADGRVLLVGGFGGDASHLGIANATIFDPSKDTFTTVPSMSYKRWYPTATTLSDGRVLVTAGWQTSAHTNAGIPEVYDPSSNTWTKLTTANNPFETYPFMFLLPNGQVVHVGGSEYPAITETLNLATQAWTTIDSRPLDGGSASMFLPNKILKAGSSSDSQNSGPSSNTSFVIDLTQQVPAWLPTPPMAYPRTFFNLTELPDGTVLASGGETDKNGGNIANAVYAAELWSPQTQAWSTMSSMHTPREYHSTALLLPDGRVLQSGMGADFGNVPDERSAEFFSPPYLFKGPRPTITSAPSQVHYGQSFFISTPDGSSIASAVLIRTGAATHFFDQNTHFVPVSFQLAAGGLTITPPSSSNAAPPGYYMLFVVNQNGVPSVAPFVQLMQ